jgi:hypothetical protein
LRMKNRGTKRFAAHFPLHAHPFARRLITVT